MKGKKLKGQALSMLVALLVIIFVLLAVVVYLFYRNMQNGSTATNKSVNSYKECVDAGYPILETYPTRCMTPDGKSFTNPDQQLNENPTDQTIDVYFSRSMPGVDESPDKVYPLKREIIGLDYGTIESASIDSLITGPSEEEQVKYYYYSPVILTGPSNCSQMDFTLTIQNKTATVQFCKNLKLNGELDDARVIATVTKTLKQFSSVSKVIVLTKDGNCVGDLSGMNSCKN